ncbi:conjugal transfer protein TraB [Streptomyces sp. ME19-01-6]|uniref:conjugal transfer protein TraB n=1 Tax=Streptomyces sp. ME19-01-6 TaxID=3028686 RepID=UPI0029B18349|nr:conjugal transfer protein TraB [Streptomyces sp. ME19-01-6]MDX3232521.1 conjugal transfer protein TraB [Streptomyces sp. ME19-01-6]
MGEIEPAKKNTPEPAGGTSKYDRLQQRLKGFAADMEQSKILLEQLAKRIDANATHAKGVASRAAATEFDEKPVGLASAVSVALGGTGVDAKKLTQMAAKLAGKADATQRTHQRLYEPLHKVRSQRRERTPKPGAFNRHS